LVIIKANIRRYKTERKIPFIGYNNPKELIELLPKRSYYA
jgi:hypothetical protein